jgi:hypothetical protein
MRHSAPPKGSAQRLPAVGRPARAGPVAELRALTKVYARRNRSNEAGRWLRWGAAALAPHRLLALALARRCGVCQREQGVGPGDQPAEIKEARQARRRTSRP